MFAIMSFWIEWFYKHFLHAEEKKIENCYLNSVGQIKRTFFHHNHSPSGSWRTWQQQDPRGCKVLQTPWCWSFASIQVHRLFPESIAGTTQTQSDEFRLSAVDSHSKQFHCLKKTKKIIKGPGGRGCRYYNMLCFLISPSSLFSYYLDTYYWSVWLYHDISIKQDYLMMPFGWGQKKKSFIFGLFLIGMAHILFSL